MRIAAALIVAAISDAERTPKVTTTNGNSARACLEFGRALDTSADAHPVGYLIIDTRNWWPGQHVLMSPYAAREISWSDRDATLEVNRDQVKGSPAGDPAGMVARDYEQRLHGHYGWPGYGW